MTSHAGNLAPSAWVARFAGLVRPEGPVLDLACGSGRHAGLFLDLGHPVTAIDRDISRQADLTGHTRLEVIEADLETGDPFPLAGRAFAGIVVTNYLWRPLFPDLIAGLESNGVLIYETFAKGNERFGKPRNPAHLLEPGELLEAVRGALHVLAYEDLIVDDPRPAAIQRICARRESV
jgi:SAM-dependent methyltransferase